MDQLCVWYWNKYFINVITVDPYNSAMSGLSSHFIDDKTEVQSGSVT